MSETKKLGAISKLRILASQLEAWDNYELGQPVPAKLDYKAAVAQIRGAADDLTTAASLLQEAMFHDILNHAVINILASEVPEKKPDNKPATEAEALNKAKAADYDERRRHGMPERKRPLDWHPV
jgi:hypothetical protein